MDKILEALSESAEANHNLLREYLGKPERKQALQLIDDETAIANALSMGGCAPLTPELSHKVHCQKPCMAESDMPINDRGFLSQETTHGLFK